LIQAGRKKLQSYKFLKAGFKQWKGYRTEGWDELLEWLK
jgi:hypothetical protein